MKKVFCAGGDVKGVATLNEVKRAFVSSRRSYELLSNYKKPYVSLVDGLAMGGAAIYSVAGKYSVVTERTSFSMPETAIGYVNDAGAAYFLPRLDNNLGVYLGMTGAPVLGFDMKKVKLASHFVDSSKLDELEKKLIGCKTDLEVQNTLNSFSSDPSPTSSKLDEILPKIEKCFGASTVEQIYENLRLDGSEWAAKTIKILNRMSPTSLKVTHRSINLGRTLSLRDCLRMEFRYVMHHVMGSDMQEGVRAVLVDKDFKPKWNPKTLQEVTEEHVARFFKPLPDGDEMTFDNTPESKL